MLKSKLKQIDQKFLGGTLEKIHFKLSSLRFGIRTFTFHTPEYFEFDGIKLKHFIHGHNVNHPPFRMTERSIELRLADLFLNNYARTDVVEVGAVTPYYWPQRVATVVDPVDAHPLVSHKMDWLSYDDDHRAILSISTFEHIGLDDYSLIEDSRKGDLALEKLLVSKSDFLVTWPGGYNKKLNSSAKKLVAKKDIRLFIWQRGKTGNNWRWIPDIGNLDFNFSYGPFWANTLMVLYRGPKSLIPAY